MIIRGKSLHSHGCDVDVAVVPEKRPAAVGILHGKYGIDYRLRLETRTGIAVVEHMETVYPAHHALLAYGTVKDIGDVAVSAACRTESKSVLLP